MLYLQLISINQILHPSQLPLGNQRWQWGLHHTRHCRREVIGSRGADCRPWSVKKSILCKFHGISPLKKWGIIWVYNSPRDPSTLLGSVWDIIYYNLGG